MVWREGVLAPRLVLLLWLLRSLGVLGPLQCKLMADVAGLMVSVLPQLSQNSTTNLISP